MSVFCDRPIIITFVVSTCENVSTTGIEPPSRMKTGERLKPNSTALAAAFMQGRVVSTEKPGTCEKCFHSAVMPTGSCVWTAWA